MFPNKIIEKVSGERDSDPRKHLNRTPERQIIKYCKFRCPCDMGKIHAPEFLTAGHLPATLYRLVQLPFGGIENGGSKKDPESIFAKVANRLSTLIGDVTRVWVDRDDRREILTVQVAGKDGTEHPARSLSAGFVPC
ncbi:MAG: hypothetical protein Q8P24_02965 [Desulfobacterales bacterium]|nr:hypothetical protein [Desulfobacterales bacterium]